MDTNFKNIIKNYLDKRAKEDSLFAEAYQKADKTLDECCNYIISQASKVGDTAVVTDEKTVYGWAVHYYDEDNLKVESVPGMAQVVTSAPKAEQTEPKTEHKKKPARVSNKQHKEEIDKRQMFLFPDML